MQDSKSYPGLFNSAGSQSYLWGYVFRVANLDKTAKHFLE